MKKTRVGILGATGMVGQRLITLLANHPWFEVIYLAASPQSAGKTYTEAVKNRWLMKMAIPSPIKKIIVREVENDLNLISQKVDLVFSALNMEKEKIKRIEEKYAQKGAAVVSNNSSHRWTNDVPMIIPEVNPHHLKLIDIQRKNRGWKKGLIVVKPNCSLQSYVPMLQALWQFKPRKAVVTTLQAISGAGLTFKTFPEIIDNVIPFIDGEEEKSEREPLKIWGALVNNKIILAKWPKISATCTRVATANGHMAIVGVKFAKKPSKKEIIKAINNFKNPINNLKLPSAPKKFLKFLEKDDRPQTKLDRDYAKGMGITIGRLREDNILDWKFVVLSHNTIRGAAGGAVLTAELLKAKGYL